MNHMQLPQQDFIEDRVRSSLTARLDVDVDVHGCCTSTTSSEDMPHRRLGLSTVSLLSSTRRKSLRRRIGDTRCVSVSSLLCCVLLVALSMDQTRAFVDTRSHDCSRSQRQQQHQQQQQLLLHSFLYDSSLLSRMPTTRLSTLPSSTSLPMVSSDASAWSNSRASSSSSTNNFDGRTKQRVRKQYKRKRIPETEKERRRLRQEREARYEEIRDDAPSIWSFDCLFPQAVWDNKSIERDLYSVKRRDQSIERNRQQSQKKTTTTTTSAKMKTSSIGASSMMRVWRDPKLSSYVLPYEENTTPTEQSLDPAKNAVQAFVNDQSLEDSLTDDEAVAKIFEPSVGEAGNRNRDRPPTPAKLGKNATISECIAASTSSNSSGKVDRELTRLVEDRIYGYRRGSNLYDTSLMGDGAIKFREGVRLGNPLPVNAARLCYYGKKELRNNRVEEAQDMYEQAIEIDPRDGRAYIGLARCAERRRDFTLARKILKIGITNSISLGPDGTPDNGANPFLLQTLGCLEEKMGNLAQAEKLFIEAAKSRPSHAASWVALGQLRTVKFRQGAAAGRACFQAAERELQRAGLPPNAHVYTAWASMEYKKAGDLRTARKLYRLALTADKRCSAAWLQLGVMEAGNEHWKEAELCFETVLKFDQRNSRVLQAYALMESKRPESDSRKVIGLFERALKVNVRDAGVLQPYALYVAGLGDLDSARKLLRRGSEVNKRHAPVWQAWGVLETRMGNPDEARRIFQEGIWACAQLSGGQSGGYKCARLWQAWGVLEAQEGDYPAARRCFSRALDADKCNIAAMTAWTLMESELGNYNDARVLYERALKQFAPGTSEKKGLWRLFELMEEKAGNPTGAQEIYRRAVGESIGTEEEEANADDIDFAAMAVNAGNKEAGKPAKGVAEKDPIRSRDKEFEVLRWDQGSSDSMKAEIWLNDGSIEGKVPQATLDKMKAKKEKEETS